MDTIIEVRELMTVGKKLNINVELLEQDEAKKFIETTLEIFTPFKVTGHLGIGNASIELPIDEWEFLYMENLPEGKGYVFFQQSNNLMKQNVVVIENLKLLGKILEKSYGMEYFLTNYNRDFLVAVNWYSIEIAGAIKEEFKKISV